MNSVFFPDFATASQFARQLGEQLMPGLLIGLTGPLGSGKTTFIGELLTGMKADRTWVHSPTFGLIHEYPASIPVVHIDLYRLEGKNPQHIAQELDNLGFRDYLDRKNLVMVEWFDRLPTEEHHADLLLDFQYGVKPEERVLTLHWPRTLPQSLQKFILGHLTSSNPTNSSSTI